MSDSQVRSDRLRAEIAAKSAEATYKLIQQLEVGITFDATGALSDRDQYDNEDAGFTFLAEDIGEFFFLIETGGVWTDGILFRGPQGEKGDAGDEVELRVESDHIQWKLEGESSWNDLIALTEITGPKGDAGDEVELRVESDHIQWKLEGESSWNDLIALTEITGPKGDKGDEVELRVESDHIQWKLTSDSNWNNLIELSELEGEKGDQGDIGIEWKGSWQAGEYQQRDAVSHLGSSWFATTTTTEEPGEDAVDWDLIAEQATEIIGVKEFNSDHSLDSTDTSHLLIMNDEGNFVVNENIIPVGGSVVLTKDTGQDVHILSGANVTFLPDDVGYVIPESWTFVPLIQVRENVWSIQGTISDDLQTILDSKADKEGDATQAFSVDTATQDDHAVTKAQHDSKADLEGDASQTFKVAPQSEGSHAVRAETIDPKFLDALEVYMARGDISESNGRRVLKSLYGLKNGSHQSFDEGDEPDYWPFHGGQISVEEERENLLLWSGDLTNEEWIHQQVSVQDSQNGWQEIIENEDNDDHRVQQSTPNLGNEKVRLSAVLKAGKRRYAGLAFGGAGATGSSRGNLTIFDLKEGVVHHVESEQENKPLITDLGGGVYLCSILGEGVSGPSSIISRVIVHDGNTSSSEYQGDGEGSIFCKQVQLEIGEFETLPILTTDSPVTRTAPAPVLKNMLQYGTGILGKIDAIIEGGAANYTNILSNLVFDANENIHLRFNLSGIEVEINGTSIISAPFPFSVDANSRITLSFALFLTDSNVYLTLWDGTDSHFFTSSHSAGDLATSDIVLGQGVAISGRNSVRFNSFIHWSDVIDNEADAVALLDTLDKLNPNDSKLLNEVLADKASLSSLQNWTPEFVPQSNSFESISYDEQEGRFIVISPNILFFWGRLRTSELTVGSASGTVRIGGLPETPNINGGVGTSRPLGWTTAPGSGIVIPDNPLIFMYDANGNGISVEDLDDATGDRNRVWVFGTFTF